MIITPVKTRIFNPPKDDLLSAIGTALPRLSEKSILAVTSKVVSIWEGSCIHQSEVNNKDDLIRREADYYLLRAKHGARIMLTLKKNFLIPTAGIDESNANGYYILWPKNPKQSAKRLYDWARKTYNIKNCGVIITDSHSVPLRRGVMGFSLAHWGFEPLNDYRGRRDLFGRELKMTQANTPDALAAAAVLVMGEGNERTPLAIIRDVRFVRFTEKPRRSRKEFSSYEVPLEEDIYAPILKGMKWKKGGQK